MTSEWQVKPLGDIVSVVIDYRGKTPKKLGGDWSIQGTRALSAKNIKTREIVQPETIRFVDVDMYKSWMKEEIQRGDILITSEAPFGEVFYWDSDEKIVLSQRLFAVRCKKEFYSPFIFQYMTSEQFQGELRGRSTGTTVTGLRQPELLKCLVAFPDYKEQVAIADTLSALDARIAENRAINNHLEQIAQAIFKSWFVDFEPFEGVMPDEWREGTFSDVISATIGGDWGKDTPSGNNTQEAYCVRGADIPDVNAGNKGKMPIRYILPKNYAVKQLTVGNIVVEISGGSPTQSTGRCALITQSLLDRYDRGMVCTNFCRAVRPLAGYSPFVYFYWKYLYAQNVMFSYENGTTGIKNLDISGFLKTEPIIIPPVDVAHQFTEAVGMLIDTVFANGLENETLAMTRDSLLPRLMSGELSVTDLGDAK